MSFKKSAALMSLVFLLMVLVSLPDAAQAQRGIFKSRKKSQETEKSANPKTAAPENAKPQTPAAPIPVVSSQQNAGTTPAADSATQARVKQLIQLIESKPTGVFINNLGKVESPPDHQPYTVDGSRNQNFKVVPDYTGSEAAYVENHEQRRAQAVQELIKMGSPAVDELCRALVWEAYEHQNIYAYVLGEIKDPRAVPALIKYMDDGVMKLKNVETVKSLGNVALAQKLEGEGKQMIADSAAALTKITGQNYGSDLSQWNAWWEANKHKVGPTPQIIQYTANPPPEKVHFDPRLLQNMPQTPQ